MECPTKSEVVPSPPRENRPPTCHVVSRRDSRPAVDRYSRVAIIGSTGAVFQLVGRRVDDDAHGNLFLSRQLRALIPHDDPARLAVRRLLRHDVDLAPEQACPWGSCLLVARVLRNNPDDRVTRAQPNVPH